MFFMNLIEKFKSLHYYSTSKKQRVTRDESNFQKYKSVAKTNLAKTKYMSDMKPVFIAI